MSFELNPIKPDYVHPNYLNRI